MTPITTISLGPSTPVAAPGPTQTGVSPLCNAWQTPAKGLGCVDFALLNGISSSQLYLWNPVLGPAGDNCTTQFWFQEYYCVGVVQGNGTLSSTTTTTTSISRSVPICVLIKQSYTVLEEVQVHLVRIVPGADTCNFPLAARQRRPKSPRRAPRRRASRRPATSSLKQQPASGA